MGYIQSIRILLDDCRLQILKYNLQSTEYHFLGILPGMLISQPNVLADLPIYPCLDMIGMKPNPKPNPKPVAPLESAVSLVTGDRESSLTHSSSNSSDSSRSISSQLSTLLGSLPFSRNPNSPLRSIAPLTRALRGWAGLKKYQY